MFSTKVKMPSKLVGLSLCAILFMTGSLFIVAYMDDTTHIDVSNSFEYDETTLLKNYNSRVEGTSAWSDLISVADTSMFLPSENDGMYALATPYDGTVHTLSLGTRIGDAVNSGELRTLVVRCDYEFSTYVQYRARIDGVTHGYTLDRVAPGVYEYTFSSAEVLFLMGNVQSDTLVFAGFNGAYPTDGVMEFGIDLYRSPTPIYVSETIVGVVGVVMIIVGLFVSPLLSGEDIKKAVRSAKKSFSEFKWRK
jgi:hypothetical protein